MIQALENLITECLMARDSLMLGSLSKLLTPFRQ